MQNTGATEISGAKLRVKLPRALGGATGRWQSVPTVTAGGKRQLAIPLRLSADVRAGTYRVAVQVKVDGKVLQRTAAIRVR